jgi:hypothetical protein
LILLFANATLWLAGSLTFIYLEVSILILVAGGQPLSPSFTWR